MKVKEIAYEASVTIAIKGNYFKESLREAVELEEGDNYEVERQKLIDRVHATVDSSIQELKKG